MASDTVDVTIRAADIPAVRHQLALLGAIRVAAIEVDALYDDDSGVDSYVLACYRRLREALTAYDELEQGGGG